MKFQMRRVVLILGLCVMASLLFWMPQVWQRMGKRFSKRFPSFGKADDKKTVRSDRFPLQRTMNDANASQIVDETQGNMPSPSNLSNSPIHAISTDLHDTNKGTSSLPQSRYNSSTQRQHKGSPAEHQKAKHADVQPADSLPKGNLDLAHTNSSSARTEMLNSSTPAPRKSRKRSPRGSNNDIKATATSPASESNGPLKPAMPDIDHTSTSSSVPTGQVEIASPTTTTYPHGESPAIAACVRPVNLSAFSGLPVERWNEYLHAIDQAVSARCDFFAYPRSEGTLVMTYRYRHFFDDNSSCLLLPG
jgi:hypothetical protein